MNWRPIETAPKDGTAILGFVPEGVETDEHVYAWPDDTILNVVPIRWTMPDDRSSYGPGWFAPFVYVSFGPWDDPSSDFDPAEVAPTHWMPLPDPPS